MDLLTTIPAAEISIPQINALHTAATQLADEARAKANAATSMALLIGLKLTALKAATPHGQWEKLFKSAEKQAGKANRNHDSDLLDFTVRTALKYIAVTAEVMNRRLTAEQAQALQQIAVAEQLAPAEAALLEEITPPESLRQLYIQMGIVKPTRREAHAMACNEAAEHYDRTPPPEPPAAPSIASKIEAKQKEARQYWFGTDRAGHTRDSTYALLEFALREGLTGRFSRMSHPDLSLLHDLFTDLAKQTKTILNA